MTHYAKGRRAEWAVRDLLQEAGAIVVRSAGSKSPADLVAMFPHRTYAVQVKCAKPTAADIAKCVEASRKTVASWVMVWWRKGGLKPLSMAWRNSQCCEPPPGLAELPLKVVK